MSPRREDVTGNTGKGVTSDGITSDVQGVAWELFDLPGNNGKETKETVVTQTHTPSNKLAKRGDEPSGERGG